MKKILFAAFAALVCGHVHAKDIVVIVNAKSPLGGKITAEKLKEIYTGKVKFEGKTKLVPADSKDSATQKAFLDKFIGMSAGAYKSNWVKKMFAQGGMAPKSIENAGGMVKHVSENAGGIGYLWDSDLTGEEEVKKATVETK